MSTKDVFAWSFTWLEFHSLLQVRTVNKFYQNMCDRCLVRFAWKLAYKTARDISPATLKWAAQLLSDATISCAPLLMSACENDNENAWLAVDPRLYPYELFWKRACGRVWPSPFLMHVLHHTPNNINICCCAFDKSTGCVTAKLATDWRTEYDQPYQFRASKSRGAVRVGADCTISNTFVCQHAHVLVLPFLHCRDWFSVREVCKAWRFSVDQVIGKHMTVETFWRVLARNAPKDIVSWAWNIYYPHSPDPRVFLTFAVENCHCDFLCSLPTHQFPCDTFWKHFTEQYAPTYRKQLPKKLLRHAIAATRHSCVQCIPYLQADLFPASLSSVAAFKYSCWLKRGVFRWRHVHELSKFPKALEQCVSIQQPIPNMFGHLYYCLRFPWLFPEAFILPLVILPLVYEPFSRWNWKLVGFLSLPFVVAAALRFTPRKAFRKRRRQKTLFFFVSAGLFGIYCSKFRLRWLSYALSYLCSAMVTVSSDPGKIKPKRRVNKLCMYSVVTFALYSMRLK